MKKILIINNDTVHIQEFIDLLSPHYSLELMHYSDFLHSMAEDYDAIILSGGANHSVLGQGRWLYQEQFRLVAQSEVPIIGVCLGFQILAYALDIEITVLDEKVHGLTEVQIRDRAFFEGASFLQVYEAHRFAVHIGKEQEVSAAVDILAESSTGVEAFRHKERPFYGFQFHPEVFHDKLESGTFFVNFLKKLLVS